MITDEEIKKVKEITEEFLYTMTIEGFSVGVTYALPKEGGGFFSKVLSMVQVQENTDAIDINITLPEPQVLIGENGNTLLDLQRLIKIVLHKKLGKAFYVKVDVNGYRIKKIEYLKKMASEMADQVSLTRLNKTLPPMSSFERRVIHSELAGRSDVFTQSQGEGDQRQVVIVAK